MDVLFEEAVLAKYNGKNYILAAGALILSRANPQLCVVFSKHSKPGYSIPGGKAQITITENLNFRPETPLEAAMREVREETGLVDLDWVTNRAPYVAPIGHHLMYTYLAYFDASSLLFSNSLKEFSNTTEGRSYLANPLLLKCGPYQQYNTLMLEHFYEKA